MASTWTSSRYNFSFAFEEGTFLYNAKSAAVLKLDGESASTLIAQLTGPPRPLDLSAAAPALAATLADGGFICKGPDEELLAIREDYWKARGDMPINLLVTTTMDCNLGCFYCFEERSGDQLRFDQVDDLVRLAETKIRQSGRRKKLNVEWFGGEPLLNREFLEAASTALQELCAREGVVYRANIVSNGTCWPDDVGSFVERHKINVAQITIDGSPEQHNRRRRVRSGREDSIGGASSFDAAWATIGKLLDHIRVDVRVNVDAKNAEEVFTVIALARASGWMSKPNKVFIYPAKLFKASEHVDFIRRGELSEDEFAHLNERVRRELTPEYSVPEFYDKPLPKHYVCGALAYDSAGVGADGRLYRCSLQLTEPHRSVGTLAAAEVRRLPVVGQSSDSAWWDSYDPTQNKKCSVCSFLPLCMGGCAKTQLEQDAIAIEQNTQYWRSTLPKTVARYIGATCRDDYVLGEREQFRTGRPA